MIDMEKLRGLPEKWRNYKDGTKQGRDASETVSQRCARELEAAGLPELLADYERRNQCEQCEREMHGENAVCLTCWNRIHAEREGHKKPCYYCKEICNSLAGNPSKWPIPLCHPDDPGKVKWHHIGCVMERLTDYERLLRECDDERLRALNEAARAQCEFCAQGLAVQPKGDDPFLDGKLWHVDGGIFRICRASAIRAIAAEQPPAVSEESE